MDGMDSNEDFRRGAAEWLQTIEEGGRRLQEVVDILCSSQGGQLGTVGGTDSLALWLEDMMQAMLDIIWELEEGPAPSLDEFVDWHRAGLLMHGCYDIFRIGQDRCAALQEGLMGYFDGLTPTSPATTNEEISGNNSFYIDNECKDNDSNDIINGGNNSLNIKNGCNDNHNNDNINSGGGGNNTNDDADKTNNNDINSNNDNNNNNRFEDINYSLFGVTVTNDNCGAIGIAGVADNDSTNSNTHSNDSQGYSDEAMDDMEIDRGCSRASRAAVWQRMGVASPPSIAGDSMSWSRLEELDPLTFADFQWMPLPLSGQLPKSHCNVLMAQLRDYLHIAIPTPLVDAGAEVVDLHDYVAKIDREFKTQRLEMLAGTWDDDRAGFERGVEILAAKLELRKLAYAVENEVLSGRVARVEQSFLRAWNLSDAHLRDHVPANAGPSLPPPPPADHIGPSRAARCQALDVNEEEREELEQAITTITTSMHLQPPRQVRQPRRAQVPAVGRQYTVLAPIASHLWVERTCQAFKHSIWRMDTGNHLVPISVKAYQFLAGLSNDDVRKCRDIAYKGQLKYCGRGNPTFKPTDVTFPAMTFIGPNKCGDREPAMWHKKICQPPSLDLRNLRKVWNRKCRAIAYKGQLKYCGRGNPTFKPTDLTLPVMTYIGPNKCGDREPAMWHKKICQPPSLDLRNLRKEDYLGALITKFGLSDDVTRFMVEAYKEDPVTMDMICKLESDDKATSDEFVMVDGLLFLEKAGFKRLVVLFRDILRSLFLGECHDATGHFGYKKTYASLVHRFWRPNMLVNAKTYVQTRQVCQRDKLQTQAPLGLLKPLPIPAGPGQSISMDFMDTLVTSKNGKRHIFVIVDRFTKYTRLIAMPETARTEHVVKLFMDNWVRDFGLPKTIVSDRDVQFTSEMWKKAAEQMGSQLQMTSGNHPEANGQAKQMNRVVQHLLRHYIKPSQNDWDKKLPLIASLYNNAVHSTTDVSPNQLHLGWKPRSASLKTGLPQPLEPLNLVSSTPKRERTNLIVGIGSGLLVVLLGGVLITVILYRQKEPARKRSHHVEQVPFNAMSGRSGTTRSSGRSQSRSHSHSGSRSRSRSRSQENDWSPQLVSVPWGSLGGDLGSLSDSPIHYSCEEIQDATLNFTHEKIGQGGYGIVYKATLRNVDLAQAAPRPDAGKSSNAASPRQLEQRLDHVLAMLGDISTFVAPASISEQLDTLKSEVRQLHQPPENDGSTSASRQYKMPTFRIEKFDDYTHQDPLTWWQGFTMELQIHQVPDHLYISALFLNAKGRCQIWLSHMATIHNVQVADLHKKISWKDMTTEWKNRFIVDDASTLAINRLFAMTEDNTPTCDWLTKWQKFVETPDLDLPFSHLRREFYNWSCAALNLALGDREQYTTFAEIIDKAREIITTNRAAAHEKFVWQPAYVEKGKFGPRPQPVAAVQPDNLVEDPAATPASREGDRVAALDRGRIQVPQPIRLLLLVQQHQAQDLPMPTRSRQGGCSTSNQLGKLSCTGGEATPPLTPPDLAALLTASYTSGENADVASPRFTYEDYAVHLVPPLDQPLHMQDSTACTISSPSATDSAASPPTFPGDSMSWSRLEKLDPLTFADLQWMPLPPSNRLPKPHCNVLMAQLRDYLHTAVPTPLMDAGVGVVDLHDYLAKIDREFKTQRYATNDAPLLYIRIQIGEATCSALIDCRAPRNYMSQDFLVRAGLGPRVRRKSQPTQVTLVNGHTHKSIDRCIDSVPVYFAPHGNEAVSFDILDTKFDMILGMSWLQSKDHPVNFYRRTIHIRD
ncbi:hypothetical protein CBR_g88526 [Chara braunii]|uniref:Integrase catalytic domain-containing protein n=1 Tax=Chara braunii TaxID=69332 RepID=A0A388KB04_CHABU|nr:hypothetical protein CBR_g88526 [Chara braunii]|eukprot:GBG67238.1 hypothetical protein CBR_g88526 [Chara braunii]